MDSLLPSTAGIKTVGAAALFATLYAILLPLYIWKTARNPTYTFIVLVIFCICGSSFFVADSKAGLTQKSPHNEVHPTCDIGRFRRGKRKWRHRNRRDHLFHFGIRRSTLLHFHPHPESVNIPLRF